MTNSKESCLRDASNELGCSPQDWEETSGPDSGHGVDYWYVRKDDSSIIIYINNDQGHFTWGRQDGDESTG